MALVLMKKGCRNYPGLLYMYHQEEWTWCAVLHLFTVIITCSVLVQQGCVRGWEQINLPMLAYKQKNFITNLYILKPVGITMPTKSGTYYYNVAETQQSKKHNKRRKFNTHTHGFHFEKLPGEAKPELWEGKANFPCAWVAELHFGGDPRGRKLGLKG